MIDPQLLAILSGSAALMDPRGTYGSAGAALNQGLQAGFGTYLPMMQWQQEAQAKKAQEDYQRQQDTFKNELATKQFDLSQQKLENMTQFQASQLDLAKARLRQGRLRQGVNQINQLPAETRAFNNFNAMPPDQQATYLNWKRANPWQDIGGQKVLPNPVNPTQTMGTLTKTLPPQEEPAVKGQQAAAAEQGKQFEEARGKWQASETKLLTTLGSMEDKNSVLVQTIDQVKPMLNSMSAEYGAYLNKWPASDARRVRNLLDTVKANIGFEALQDMRNNSPTGGALGQVSEMENRLLQAVWGSLDQGGKVEDITRVLDRIVAQRGAALERMKYAYDLDRKKFSTSLPGSAPMPTMKQNGVIDWNEMP
jgi:hypothetical protein